MTASNTPWHPVYPACLDCGGTDRPHNGRGICQRCARDLGKPGYDGNAAPSQGQGGRRLGEDERREIAERAIARARARGWRPHFEQGDAEGDVKGWFGDYHACIDCGSDKRPHAEGGRCALCHMRHTGHTPTALESALIDGAEPPLARAAGTNLPPEAPAPSPHVLPRRDHPALPAALETDAQRLARLHREARERAAARQPEPVAPPPEEDLAAPDPVAPEPAAPYAPTGYAMADIPTAELVAELRRRQDAAQRAYERALAEMEALDDALGALAAPASARALRRGAA